MVQEDSWDELKDEESSEDGEREKYDNGMKEMRRRGGRGAEEQEEQEEAGDQRT